MVTFGEAIKLYFTNYVNFKGRSSRSEFWWAILFLFVVAFVIGIIDTVIFGATTSGSTSLPRSTGINPITSLFNLATFLPSLAITVRRLHDIGKKGWWILLAYAPTVGFIIGILFLLAISFTSNSAASSALLLVGFLILAGIASIVVGIIFIIWMCKPSVGPNEWGYPRSLDAPYSGTYSQGYQPQGGYGYQQQPQQNWGAPQAVQQNWPQPGMPQHPGYIAPQPQQPVNNNWPQPNSPATPSEGLQSPFKYGPPETPGIPSTPPQPPQTGYNPPQFGNNPFQNKDKPSQ